MGPMEVGSAEVLMMRNMREICAMGCSLLSSMMAKSEGMDSQSSADSVPSMLTQLVAMRCSKSRFVQ